jgi:hypothetical protein
VELLDLALVIGLVVAGALVMARQDRAPVLARAVLLAAAVGAMLLATYWAVVIAAITDCGFEGHGCEHGAGIVLTAAAMGLGLTAGVVVVGVRWIRRHRSPAAEWSGPLS